MKISIIIPVYNAEKYLERCVDSVLNALSNSRFKGEVLLINNNSTDKSPELMKKLQKKHPKIISVLQCNTPGASAVRNFGVQKARGEYIWFIDADDEIAKKAVDRLISAAEDKKADLVMMGAERVFADGRRDYLSAVKASSKDFKHRFVRYGMGPWQILIRREWWLKNDFAFKEGVIHEDMELMSALILDTDNFASVDEPLYFYYQNSGSVLHQEAFNPHVFDIFENLESLYRRFEDKKAVLDYHDDLEWFFIWNLLVDSARDFRQFPEGRPGFGRSRELLKKYFPNWRKNRFLRQKSLPARLKIRLNYYGII